MITAIASRVMRGVEVDPVILGAAGKMVDAFANSVALEREASLEATEIDAARTVKIDPWFHCRGAPVPSEVFASEKCYTPSSIWRSAGGGRREAGTVTEA